MQVTMTQIKTRLVLSSFALFVGLILPACGTTEQEQGPEQAQVLTTGVSQASKDVPMPQTILETTAPMPSAAQPAKADQPGKGQLSGPRETNTVDGCHYPGQHCRCSNTGWYGYCDYGPVHRGVYCHC